jgi:hypothetical protein
MSDAIAAYHSASSGDDQAICERLRAEINRTALRRWLDRAREVQWDYKKLSGARACLNT